MKTDAIVMFLDYKNLLILHPAIFYKFSPEF
jgi:hypothetical protein